MEKNSIFALVAESSVFGKQLDSVKSLFELKAGFNEKKRGFVNTIATSANWLEIVIGAMEFEKNPKITPNTIKISKELALTGLGKGATSKTWLTALVWIITACRCGALKLSDIKKAVPTQEYKLLELATNAIGCGPALSAHELKAKLDLWVQLIIEFDQAKAAKPTEAKQRESGSESSSESGSESSSESSSEVVETSKASAVQEAYKAFLLLSSEDQKKMFEWVSEFMKPEVAEPEVAEPEVAEQLLNMSEAPKVKRQARKPKEGEAVAA